MSIGTERAMDALRKALAMGADRAVLISDPSLEGADLLGTARALAGALEQEGADLVLFGQQSADGGGAVFVGGSRGAAASGLSISQVSELTAEGGSVTGKRQTEFGYDSIRAPFPAVIAIWDAINTPRYPSLKGIMGAKKKPQARVVSRRRRRRGGVRHDRRSAEPAACRAARPARSKTTARGPRRSSSFWPRRGSSDGEDASLPGASRRRDRRRARSVCSQRRHRSVMRRGRARRLRRARFVGGQARRRADGLGRGRRTARCAAAATARRRDREAGRGRRLRHGSFRAVGARRRRGRRSRRAPRRGAELGPRRVRRRDGKAPQFRTGSSSTSAGRRPVQDRDLPCRCTRRGRARRPNQVKEAVGRA